MRLIGYVRVSRVAGREGDSFLSPTLQRERIEAHARAHGHTITAWEQDLDQPGSRYERPRFQASLRAVEAGDADGIAVAKLDRFARSVSGAARALERLEAAGGVLVAVDLGMDTSTPAGRLMRNVLSALAEFELDRIRDNWDDIRAKTIERGIHISRVSPVGYRRDAQRRLEPDPIAGPVIRDAFRRRVAGHSWEQLCSWLDKALPRPEGRYWTRQTLSGVFENQVYLGEAYAGAHVNARAHEPLVSRLEWEGAQSGARTWGRRSGTLLAGILRCASCGYTLTIATDGKRGYSNYRCRIRHGGAGVCPDPARISLRRAEPLVEEAFLEWAREQTVELEPVRATVDAERAVAALEDAEMELVAYRDETLIALVGRELFAAGLTERARRVDAARDEVAEIARRREGPVAPLHELVADWPTLDVQSRNAILRSAIDAVFVRPAGHSGRAPIGARVHICWSGEGPTDLPGGTGRRGPVGLRPFRFPPAPEDPGVL